MEGSGENLTSGHSESDADESVALTSIMVVISVFTLFTTILVAARWEQTMKRRMDGLGFGLYKFRPHLL